MQTDYQIGAFLDDAPPRYRVTRGTTRVRYTVYGCRGSRNPLAHREEDAHRGDATLLYAQARPRTGDAQAVQRGTWLLCGLCVVGWLVVSWVG